MYGIGGGILSIDLSNGDVRVDNTDESLIKDYLGGDGLAVRLFVDRADPAVDPFDPANPLVFAPGLLNGLPVPTAGKCVFVSKSPLTGTIAESVMGGSLGARLKHAGFDALVITGRAEAPSLIEIRDGRVEIREAAGYWGMFTRDASESIRKDLRADSVAVIGPAGEKLVRYASIDCEDRQAGRAGLGAVMGSKNLKAIAVSGTRPLTVADKGALIDLALKWQKTMESSGAFIDDTKYGTGEFLNWVNEERGVFPTRNWQKSVFERRQKIDPYYWAPRYSLRNKACFSCTKACGKLFTIKEGPYAGTVVDGIEYETLYSLGGETECDDVEAVARANEICDLYGIDTISAGVTIGFTMEMVERGTVTTDEVGADCRFGNSAVVPEMCELIGKREGFGKLMGEGVRRMAEKIGKGTEEFALHVKGMEPPAYDVRGLKGMGLGFMTSPRGACHLRSGMYAVDLIGKFWKFENVDRLSAEGRGEQVKLMEDFMTVYDSLGVCKFSRGFFLLEGFKELLQVTVGMDGMDEDRLLLAGERINNLKQLFNYSAGIRREDFYLPKRITGEPISGGPSEGAVITEEEMNAMLDDYFAARGWEQDGKPSQERLKSLGLT